MSAYSKEYALGPKARALAALQQLANDIESGKIKMSGNEPKMTLRVLRSLRMSTDATFKELVSKWDKGEITIEQLKNKGRTLIENKLPKPLRRTESDRIHHGTPLEIGAVLENMPPEELYTFLVEKEKEDVFFGDSDKNIRGGSYDEREHTGARPKASKSKTVYPNEYGPPGVTQFSGHPRGTRDPFYNIPDRPTTAAEAAKVIAPLLEQNAKDQELARQVAKPRRDWINNYLVEQNVIEKGVDIFSKDIDDATLKKVAPYLKAPDIQRQAAEAFKTPIRFEGGQVHYHAVDPISAAMTPLMKNRIGALTGIFFEGYNKETIQKFEQGDIEGGVTDVATGAVAGAAIEKGAKTLGVEKALGRAAAPIAGASLFAEGREGSTTDYLVRKYGPKVGMSTYDPKAAGGPAWRGLSEAVPMPTEDQKPGHVQAVEDAIDWVGGVARLGLQKWNELSKQQMDYMKNR